MNQPAPFIPADEAELSALITEAAAQSRPIEVVGGGTRRAVGGLVAAETRVSTAGMSGVSLFEPGALTLVAGAGTPLAEVEATLAAERQRLAFEPGDWRGLMGTSGEPTIGGAVAANLSGPRRIQAGACRDSLIGVRFVDGRGRVLKNGGRVMKNVTGYDLVKLLSGSYGALGVLTELAFKTAPAPEASAMLLLRGLDDARAVEALCAALSSPFEITGAAHLPSDCAAGVSQADEQAVTLLRIESFAEAVRYRGPELAKLLAPFGAAEIVEDQDQVAKAWALLRDVTPFAGAPGAVWRISVRPTDGPAVGDWLREALGARVFYDWGGGLVWALAPGSAGPARTVAEAIRAKLAPLGGHATLIRAAEDEQAGDAPAFQPLPARLASLSAQIKARFDPAGILNPGKTLY